MIQDVDVVTHLQQGDLDIGEKWHLIPKISYMYVQGHVKNEKNVPDSDLLKKEHQDYLMITNV